MSGGDAVEELLSLAQARRSYLSLLSAAPEHKRDIIDELGDSRSTVDRAVDRLREHGLVTRTNDGAWTVTTKGDVLFRTVEETRSCVESVANAEDLLRYLPCEEPVPPALFRDAVVDVADGPTPLAIAERVRETIADATGIRGLAAADHGTGVKEDIFEATFGGDFTFEYVFDESLVERILPGDEVPWNRLVEAADAELVVTPDIPFGLMLTDHEDGERATLIVYDDRSVVRGQVQSDNPEAVAWGTGVFERYRERGTPLPAWLDANGR